MTIPLLLRHATRPFASLEAFAGPRAEAAGSRLLDVSDETSRLADTLEAALHAAAGPRSEERGRARLAILALKRDVHNRRAPSDADLDAASPALPPEAFASLEAYRRSLAGLADAEAAWEAAFDADLEAGRRAIVDATQDPLVATGIALAGRSLGAKLRALRRDEAARWGHGARHVAAKALAYVARFATKTSPNSVFCATALAESDGTRAAVAGRPVIDRVDLILNVAEARKVACVLAADEAVEAAIVPRPNPTLRTEPAGLVFWRFASFRNANDDEALSRVKDHPVLRAVLDEARAAVPLPELRRRVAARCRVGEEALAPFLRQMIAAGVLIAEIEIPYNERRPLLYVARRASNAGCAAPWIAGALAIEDEVDRLGATVQAAADGAARARIEAALAALPHARPIKNDELFRIDAAGAAGVTVPRSVIADLQDGLTPYIRLFAALYPARRYRQGWIDRFLARFPADEDVSLTEVYRVLTEQADSYRPPAFPEPRADGTDAAERSARTMTAVREHLAAAARAAAPGESIAFDAAVLERLAPGLPDPRWACGVLFQIAAKEAGAIERGGHLLVLNGLFHGAGLSLSRFAHLLGGPGRDDANPIVRELRRAWSVVERPGAIVAELTYNHLGRTANAGLRPAIFGHEIELPGDRASDGVQAHGLSDLVVRFDSGLARFVLRLASDGTEVIPVINSGVSPVGFVSFLVAIGEQELQPLAYFPGFDDPGVTRWPRIVAGRLVLFRERWVFRRGAWPAPPARGDDLRAFARAALSWRRRWRLPRHVFVHSSAEPKPRYIDLASPVFLDLLRRDLAALDGGPDASLHVTEMLPGPEDLFLRDGDAGHACEFLVQLHGGPI